MKTATINRILTQDRIYVLRSGSFYVGNLDPVTMENPLVTDKALAMRLDWRDNEEAKARFFSVLHDCPFVAEEIKEGGK